MAFVVYDPAGKQAPNHRFAVEVTGLVEKAGPKPSVASFGSN